MKAHIKDLLVLSVMSVMFVSTFFLFLFMLQAQLQGGIFDSFDINYYGEGVYELIAIGLGLIGGPFVICDYIYGNRASPQHSTET